METCFIRPAAVSEKKLLDALELRTALNNPGDRDNILAHPDAIEVPLEQIAEGRVFVAERNGVILGCASIEPRADGDTELDGLFVDPDNQRRGIGRRLVEHCAAIARANGSNTLHVIGNTHAKEFYNALGFETVGTTQTRFSVALVMRKSLTIEKSPSAHRPE